VSEPWPRRTLRLRYLNLTRIHHPIATATYNPIPAAHFAEPIRATHGNTLGKPTFPTNPIDKSSGEDTPKNREDKNSKVTGVWVIEAGLTDEGQDDEEDVEPESRARGGEEVRDGADLDDDRGDGGREEQLEREDDVDLADERPAQLGALLHPRVQRPLLPRGAGGPRLEVAALLVPERRRHLGAAEDDDYERLSLSLSLSLRV
jgi:hypothetical protein